MAASTTRARVDSSFIATAACGRGGARRAECRRVDLLRGGVLGLDAGASSTGRPSPRR